jgi:hypothetical protein
MSEVLFPIAIIGLSSLFVYCVAMSFIVDKDKEKPKNVKVKDYWDKIDWNPTQHRYRVKISTDNKITKFSWIETTDESLIELHQRIYKQYNLSHNDNIFITKLDVK